MGNMRCSCSAFNCANTTETDQKISFFRFPKDTERCRQWIINSRREDLMNINEKHLHNNYRLCSAHFEESQFSNPFTKNRLTWNAIPTIFNIPNFPVKLEVGICCRMVKDDYQTNKKRSIAGNEKDLQSKPISTLFMQNSLSGIVKESSFSAVKLPFQNVRESQLCLPHEESQQTIRGQRGESNFLDSLHSLPKDLVLRQSTLHRNCYGIWSKENIPEGTRYGPYSGILINDPNEEQATEVKNKDERDETPSNWLAYINHAFSKEQQNLIAFQFQGQIFYISCTNIPVNTELLAGYKCEHGSVKTSTENRNNLGLCGHSCQNSYRYDTCENFPAQHYLKQDIADNKINFFESFRNHSFQEMIRTKGMPNEYSVCQKKVIQVISSQRRQMLRIATNYICDKCGKRFGQSTELKTHKRLHVIVKPYNCDDCGKLFRCNYNLKIHQRRAHTGEKPYKCNECEKRFAGSSDLKFHQKRIHANERPYGCDECHKKFAFRVDLRLHKRIHVKGKPLECDLCGKKFAHNALLTRHKIRLHTMKHYECDICEKKFAVVGDFNRHKKVHFPQDYKCDDCGKHYAFHSSLTRHKKHHASEKPYKCDLCVKQFIEKTALLKHKMRHAGQKPYECDYCGKKFAERYNLKTHKFVHTGEKPYKCNDCGKQFTEKWKLKSHRIIHIGLPDNFY